jgi:hypothetical protein
LEAACVPRVPLMHNMLVLNNLPLIKENMAFMAHVVKSSMFKY